MNKEELQKYIGKKIKEYRNKCNMTQGELGKRLGVKNSAISMYERGVNSFDANTLFAIANIFEIKADDLFPPRDYAASLDKLEGKNLFADDMYYFQELTQNLSTLPKEEKDRVLEFIKFTVQRYKKD